MEVHERRQTAEAQATVQGSTQYFSLSRGEAPAWLKCLLAASELEPLTEQAASWVEETGAVESDLREDPEVLRELAEHLQLRRIEAKRLGRLLTKAPGEHDGLPGGVPPAAPALSTRSSSRPRAQLQAASETSPSSPTTARSERPSDRGSADGINGELNVKLRSQREPAPPPLSARRTASTSSPCSIPSLSRSPSSSSLAASSVASSKAKSPECRVTVHESRASDFKWLALTGKSDRQRHRGGKPRSGPPSTRPTTAEAFLHKIRPLREVMDIMPDFNIILCELFILVVLLSLVTFFLRWTPVPLTNVPLVIRQR